PPRRSRRRCRPGRWKSRPLVNASPPPIAATIALEMIAVRKSVLVVAQQIQLRARIARVLHSAGYCAELAENPKRALELAARKDIQAAIVVQSPDLADLGQELRDKISTTILLGHRTDNIVRPGDSLQGTDVLPEDELDERKLLDLLSGPEASPGSKDDEAVP